MKRIKNKNTVWYADKPKLTTEANRIDGKTMALMVVMLALLVSTVTLVVISVLPKSQIKGGSMAPTLNDGELVIWMKEDEIKYGDIVAFSCNDNHFVKRVIGQSGDWINIDEDGTVYVNGEQIDEPYIADKAYGNCDLEFPFQVPEGKFFMMGDHRSTSIDSRHSSVGCIEKEDIEGKILYRIWPLNALKAINCS